MNSGFSIESLKELYEWVDKIPLSRKKRNISRDFSDGVLMAELIHRFHPTLVTLSSYHDTGKPEEKKANWEMLNIRVFKKLGFMLTKKEIENIVEYEPDAVELVLFKIKDILEKGEDLSKTKTFLGNALKSQKEEVMELMNPRKAKKEKPEERKKKKEPKFEDKDEEIKYWSENVKRLAERVKLLEAEHKEKQRRLVDLQGSALSSQKN